MKVESMPASCNRRAFLQSAALAGGSLLVAARSAQAVPDAATPLLSPASKVTVTDVRTYRLKDALFVQIISDAGVSGWSEAGSNNPRVVETIIQTTLKQHVIGRSVWDAEPVWDEMFFVNRDLGPAGGLTSAIAGIDIALWDLKGRLTGLPVYRLLGGKYRTRIRAVGNVGMSKTPDDAARQAARLVERGFTAVKLRVQIDERNINPHPDPVFVYAQAIKRAVGDQIEFCVDLDNGYTAARAIELGKRLRSELGVNYLEQPVSTLHLRELAQVSEALDLPIIAGQNECTRWHHRDLMDIGNVGILALDVGQCGLTEAKKIAALAQACSKPILPHTARTPLSTAAALHLMASISNAGPFVEYMEANQFGDLAGLVQGHVKFEDGFLTVPPKPGLGLEVDEPAITRATREG
jgi:L-alanine-DL-glutamate epimerase-like enolase superfamily enzyme